MVGQVPLEDPATRVLVALPSQVARLPTGRTMTYIRALSGIVGWLLSSIFFFVAFWHLDGSACVVDESVRAAGVWAISMIGGLIVLALATPLIRFGQSHAVWMRWMAVPHIITFIYGGSVVFVYFLDVTIDGVHLCDAYHYPYHPGVGDAPAWHRAFAPVHLVALAWLLLLCWRVWRQGNRRAH